MVLPCALAVSLQSVGSVFLVLLASSDVCCSPFCGVPAVPLHFVYVVRTVLLISSDACDVCFCCFAAVSLHFIDS